VSRTARWLPLVLLLLTSGCAISFDATSLGVPASLANAAETPAVGTPFKVTSRATYAFWGLFRVSQPSLRKALAAQLVDGTQVADVKIRVRSRFTDLLITGLTAGLIVPRSVTYEGVVVGP
jgi:hypothetical protein